MFGVFLLLDLSCIFFLSQAGMILDNGVKTTQANDKDKRPFLSLIGARSDPVNLFTLHDELKPRHAQSNPS